MFFIDLDEYVDAHLKPFSFKKSDLVIERADIQLELEKIKKFDRKYVQPANQCSNKLDPNPMQELGAWVDGMKELISEIITNYDVAIENARRREDEFID